MTLVESLNVSAYKKAKQKVAELQAQPNIMTGLTKTDYQQAIAKDSEEKKEAGIRRLPRCRSPLRPEKPEPPREEKVLRYDRDGNLIR